MTQHEFTIRRGVVAAPGAATNPLTNIRPVMQPVGPIKAIFDRLTGTYTDLEKTYMAQAWFDLYDGGVLAKLDQLCMPGRTLNDILIPWKTVKGIQPVNTGGALGSGGLGISLVSGESDFIGTGIVPSVGGFNYALNSASMGVKLTASPAFSGFVFGPNQSSGPCRMQRSSSPGANMTGFINSADAIQGAVGASLGVIGMNRTGASAAEMILDGVTVVAEASNASVAVPTGELMIGRLSGTYSTLSACGWWVGAGLTDTEKKLLADTMNFIHDLLF